VRLVTDGQVTQTNRAVAYASCVNCRTVAVAFQVVLVEGTPSVLTPVNQATALNQVCAQCVTYAAAKQLVIGVDGPVQLTATGEDRLAAVGKDLKALRSDVATITLVQLLTRVNAIQAELESIYTTELVAADGQHAHADVVALDAA
jgi:putative peptide zinc metalloprotease protein